MSLLACWGTKSKKANLFDSPLQRNPRDLDGADVLGLPAFRALGHVELDLLAFLQAAEDAGLNGREMNENVFAGLTADEAVALGIVKPLYCSLFHIVVLVFLLCSYAGESRRKNRADCC